MAKARPRVKGWVRRVGAVTCPIAVGLIMSADPATFASCLLVLALLSTVGIWALQPGRHRPPVMFSR
jgi:hypothetical protein